jgi:hypothetical protein
LAFYLNGVSTDVSKAFNSLHFALSLPFVKTGERAGAGLGGSESWRFGGSSERVRGRMLTE